MFSITTREMYVDSVAAGGGTVAPTINPVGIIGTVMQNRQACGHVVCSQVSYSGDIFGQRISPLLLLLLVLGDWSCCSIAQVARA